MISPFATLPDNFFSPLAYGAREHYGALLIVFYNLFLEFPTGVERSVVVSKYEEYFFELSDLEGLDEGDEESRGDDDLYYEKTPRGMGNRFLRRLIQCGWMSEETLHDYTEIINITSYAKPFYEALDTVIKGSEVEYESHIVGIYSSLCNESVDDNGHHAVLNAHYHTRLLIESLKVLSQNIKAHIQNIYQHEADIKDILHFHYDIYMNEVVDRAYNRLKTSDNLSKYRPMIIHTINTLLQNEEWLKKTSEKFSLIKALPREQTESIIISMLKEIKNDLKSIDPILEEIDDKNRRYSKISTEMIKLKLYSDSSLKGKINDIVLFIQRGELNYENVPHNIQRSRFLRSDSLFYRRFTASQAVCLERSDLDDSFEIEMAETELRLRIKKQLNPEKISEFLKVHSKEGSVLGEDIATGMENFVKLLYATIYSESRDFDFIVKWYDEYITIDRFRFKRHRFIKR